MRRQPLALFLVLVLVLVPFILPPSLHDRGAPALPALTTADIRCTPWPRSCADLEILGVCAGWCRW